MKYGRVVRMRLSPADVMSVIDVVKTAGVYTEGMSLDQVCRLTMSALLESARNAGTIPRREGYEYSDMIAPFTGEAVTAKTMQITKAFDDSGLKPTFGENLLQSHTHVVLPDAIVRKKGRVMVRLLELEQRLDVDPDNFTETDQQKLLLVRELLQKLNNGEDVEIQEVLNHE